MINKKRLLKTTQGLIRINSENPPGNERRIALFVKAYLERLGLRAKIYEFARERSNIIAVLKGRKSERSLLITPHLDTVPAGKSWQVPAFAALIKGGRLYGLGATDCKCNLAVSLEVINSLIEDKQKLGYDLIFAATADEESGSALGLEPLLKRKILRPDAALVLDADDFEIVVAQKGLLHLKVKVKGKKAHGAYPWLGANAIDASIRVLDALKRDREARNRQQKKNKYLREPTINIGTIKGGDKVNVVADWCEFELDYRFLPPDTADGLIRRISSIVAKETDDFSVEIEGEQKPFLIEEKHPLVHYLKEASLSSGLKPRVSGSEGATTISFFQAAGIPAVAIGFGTEGCAHIAGEYVRLKNLYLGARFLEGFLKTYKFN